MRLDNVDGFSFDFTDALDAFVFDEKDKAKRAWHPEPMKAVDIVVELQDAYLFVEIKDFNDPAAYDVKSFANEDELQAKRDGFRWLKNYLKYKYRDTYLSRYAEKKVDKPIYYICLLTFDNALNTTMQKALQTELPVGLAAKRWKQEIASSCQVVNLAKWNKNFPKWPVSRALS